MGLSGSVKGPGPEVPGCGRKNSLLGQVSVGQKGKTLLRRPTMFWRQVEGLGSLKEIKVDKYLLSPQCQGVHWARWMPLGKSRQVSAGALCPPLALGVSWGQEL